MRRRLVLTLGAAALSALPTLAQQVDEDAWRPHRALKVLYAGKEGGHREQVFGAFLQRWFDKSDTIPFADLSMRTAADWDVVIVDWVSQYGNDGYPPRESGLFRPPKELGPEFTKPMISMSYVSDSIRGAYKLDWL